MKILRTIGKLEIASIFDGGYRVFYHELPGVSICGYGCHETEAFNDLLTKTLLLRETALISVLEKIHGKNDRELNLSVAYFWKDGRPFIEVKDLQGRKKIIPCPYERKKNENQE